MALPSVPSSLRGLAQARGPVFDPRTGTFVYPSFVGTGFSTTGYQPPAVTPGTPTPTPAAVSPTLNGFGLPSSAAIGTSQAGLRAVYADRGGGGPGTDRPAPSAPTGRVNLTTGLGDALDLAGMALPGTLGTMATIGEAGIAASNAQYSKDQLQAAGYGQGLPGSAIAGAALGQVTPGGIIGNDLGAGDANSALAAASRAEKAAADGRDTYHDPSGLKTSPSGPVSRNPTYAGRTAPMPGQPAAAPAATTAPSAAPTPTNALGTPSAKKTGIRSVSAGAGISPGWSRVYGGRSGELQGGYGQDATHAPGSDVGNDSFGGDETSGSRGGGQGSGGGGGVGRGGAGSRDSSGSYN